MKKKKKFWYRTWMGYCPTELKAGLGTGRTSGARGTTQAAWARELRVSGCTGAGRWARGASRHTGAGRWGAGRAEQAGARGPCGKRTLGKCAARARGRRARAAGARQAGTRGAAGARGTTGWVAWARPGRATGPMGCALGALSLF